MTYFEIQTHSGEKIGGKVYFDLSLARRVARSAATKRRNNAATRGGMVRIIERDPSAIYGGEKVIERFEH